MACIRPVQEPRILQKSKNNNKIVKGAKQRSPTTPKTVFVFWPKERQTWDAQEGREYSGGEALKERCMRGDWNGDHLHKEQNSGDSWGSFPL